MTTTDLRLYEIIRIAKEHRATLNGQFERLLSDAAVIPMEWGPQTAAKMAEIIQLYDELISANDPQPPIAEGTDNR